MPFLFIKNIKIGLIVFLFLNTYCIAQSQIIKGSVEGQGEGTLAGASVILYESDSTSMLGFCITDEWGRWQIDTKAAAGMVLSASYLGYETSYIKLFSNDLQLDSIRIRLESAPEKLSEVVVQAKRLSIVVSGDTITYNASAFRREGDQTLGDILQKMPGVEVAPGGDILYKGKRVDKLLVEGRDILADQHKLTTEGFQADDIQAIQFIEQYRPFSEQYLPFNTGKVAMDIQLTDKAKNRVKGDVELLGGYRRAYEASANLYRVGEKSGLTAFARTNTVGEPVMSQGDFLSLQGDFMKVLNQTMGDFSQIIPEGFNATSDVQRNFDNVVLVNFEQEKTKDAKIRLAALGNFSHRETASDVARTYNLAQATQNGRLTRETAFSYFYTKMDLQRRFPDRKSLFTLELPVYADLSNKAQHYEGEIANSSANNAFGNRQQKFRMSPDFRFSKQFSPKKRISFEADAFFESLEKRSRWLQESTGGTTLATNQSKEEKTGQLDSKLAYAHMTGNWQVGGSIGTLVLLRDKLLRSPEAPLYNADLQHILWRPKASASLRYEKDAWMGEGKLAIEHNKHRLDKMHYQNTLAQSSVSLRYAFNLLHYILLETSIEQKENPYNLADGTFELQDDNTLRHNSLTPGSYATTFGVSLNYAHFKLDKNTRLHTFLNYSRSQGALFQDFLVENGLFVQSYAQTNNSSTFGLRNLFSWKWPAKNMRFGLETALGLSKMQAPSNENIEQRNIEQKLEAHYEPKSGLSLGYTYKIWQQKRIWEAPAQTFLSQAHDLSAVYTKNALRIKTTIGHRQLNSTGLHNQFTRLDIESEYRLKNNWTLQLHGRDLFNLSPRTVYSNKMTLFYNETAHYTRFPATVTLGFKKLL
jgi:hypothetical protein